MLGGGSACANGPAEKVKIARYRTRFMKNAVPVGSERLG